MYFAEWQEISKDPIGAQIVKPPKNTIGTLESSVMLFCELVDKTSEDTVIWWRQLLSGNVEILFDSSDPNNSENSCDKFCIVGNFNLEIHNLKFEDAGNYTCDLVGKDSRTVSLSVARK